MGGVAAHSIQALFDGHGGDHRIGSADGLADAVEIAGDAARQFGGGQVERYDFFGSNRRHEGVQPVVEMSAKAGPTLNA